MSYKNITLIKIYRFKSKSLSCLTSCNIRFVLQFHLCKTASIARGKHKYFSIQSVVATCMSVVSISVYSLTCIRMDIAVALYLKSAKPPACCDVTKRTRRAQVGQICLQSQNAFLFLCFSTPIE